MQATGPNAQQIEYWNEAAGPKWAELADTIDAQVEPLGREAMERIGVAPGERVLDVGCGCGQTTLGLAERVGVEGTVLGLDISEPMLERARQRALAASTANVRFERGDAQIHALEAESLDLVFSRFGTMFFVDPIEAFRNLKAALRPGGRLGFVCWQAITQNPWMLRPMAAVAALLELAPPADPHAPGPFAFADAGRLRSLLETAGLADVRIEPHEQELLMGGGADLDGTVRFLLQMGPAAAALREASDAVREQAAKLVREAVAPFAGESGVRMASASWIVSARRPE